jgi:dTDP-glucose 4,6-dehydratase
MKTILITGCAGFIGSHLTDYFLNNNYKVIGIDNLITGLKSNIQRHITNNNFNFFEHDICYYLDIEDKIDYILHFASPASPKDYLRYPIETLKTGSIGTENVLNLALKNKATVLVASTSEIYGDPLIHPQSESYFGNVNPIGERSVYDEAKRYLEALTMAYKVKFNLNIRIARIFNTYGPRMKINDGRAIPNFINQALENKDLTVYGDGSQTRSFCYINDTVRGISKLLEKNFHDPVNIGNPEEYSILQLANIIKKNLSPSVKIIHKKLPENDPKKRKPNIDLARKILNWEPTINLHDGLNKTIQYYQNLPNFKR